MSPFLADVKVVRLTGASSGSTPTPAGAEARAQVDAVFQTIHSVTDGVLTTAHDAAVAALAKLEAKVRADEASSAASEAAQAKREAAQEAAEAKREAAEAKAEAAKEKEAADEDGDTDSVNIQKDGKSIIVHHGKSHHEDDIPFAILPIVVVTFTFFYLIVRALMSPFSNRSRRAPQPAPVVVEGLSDEEAAVLEKLQRTLAQMESRVESLETILIDQNRTKEKYGTKL